MTVIRVKISHHHFLLLWISSDCTILLFIADLPHTKRHQMHELALFFCVSVQEMYTYSLHEFSSLFDTSHILTYNCFIVSLTQPSPFSKINFNIIMIFMIIKYSNWDHRSHFKRISCKTLRITFSLVGDNGNNACIINHLNSSQTDIPMKM